MHSAAYHPPRSFSEPITTTSSRCAGDSGVGFSMLPDHSPPAADFSADASPHGLPPRLDTQMFSGDRYVVRASTVRIRDYGYLLKWTADPAVHEDFNTNGLVRQRVGWSVVGNRVEQLTLLDDLMIMAGL